MRRYDTITILTGAGISAESGLPTFRDGSLALWAETEPERVGTVSALRDDRPAVIDFFNMRRRIARAAIPNAAHRALAALERNGRRRVHILTQNIDDLHERAGSRDVRHLHGEIGKARCAVCDAVALLPGDLDPAASCVRCGADDALRPHVVLFGETPRDFGLARQAAASCDLFLSIGTSGAVQPAAGLVETARRSGAETVSINLYPQKTDAAFDGVLHGGAGNIVSELVECLLANRDWRDVQAVAGHGVM